jgi:hypothetical protein
MLVITGDERVIEVPAEIIITFRAPYYHWLRRL